MVDNDNCYQIILRRKNEKHIIPISKQALTILGVINDEPQNVFKLSYTASLCVNLNKWAIRAGITQKLTFSSGRQTFGKLLLQQGVALPLISELLGHKHLKTTIHFLGIEKITIPVKSDYLLDLRI
jgi:integrase